MARFFVPMAALRDRTNSSTSRSAHIEATGSMLSGIHFEARLSEAILQKMCEKWVFIATGAGITCLMSAAAIL